MGDWIILQSGRRWQGSEIEGFRFGLFSRPRIAAAVLFPTRRKWLGERAAVVPLGIAMGNWWCQVITGVRATLDARATLEEPFSKGSMLA